MRNIFLVAKREYLEQIRGRSFRVTTILMPLVFMALVGVIYFVGRSSGTGKNLVIATQDLQLAQTMRDSLLADKDTQTQVEILTPSVGGKDHAELVQRVLHKSIDGFLWIETPPGQPLMVKYESQTTGDFITKDRLQSALNKALVRERLASEGMSGATADELMKVVTVDTKAVDKEGKEEGSNAVGSYAKGYIMAFLLSMTTMIYGLNVARSIIQEKTSRIFEVMLAIAKPGDMLAGKLIGVGAVGMTQIVIWAVAGAAILAYPATVAVLSGKLSIHVSVGEGILFVLYFVLGYLLYSALFAGLAATCETEQELQMYTPLAAVPIWLGFSLNWLIINNPNSMLSIAVSLFPPTAPIVMFLRIGSQMPPAWQFMVSIALLALSILAVLWFSTKLYRVGILMYGKRATLPEMLRWLRYS